MIVIGSVWRALLTVGQVALVIVPLTVAYQVLRDSPWVRRRLRPYRGAFRGIGLGEGALVALATGVVLGIVYGAGILIQEARQGKMSPREIFLLALFLGTCHAVIEDTLLFVVVGGRAAWMLGPRVLLAVAATAGLTWLLGRRTG